MTKSRLYLVLQAAVCIALVVYLCVSAVGIYREGTAVKAEHPMESVYTPEAVAGKFAPIAPLLFVGAALLIAGLALGIRDENAEKPVKDAELQRDLLVFRVMTPSAGMLAERRKQKQLMRIGRGAFALCMLPILVYLLNPDHFPQSDLEGMFHSLMRVLLPWTMVALGALAVTSVLREKSVLRETKAAQVRLKEEQAEGLTVGSKCADPPKKAGPLQTALIIIAVFLILAGVFNGSALDVLYKAITICTECVGLG